MSKSDHAIFRVMFICTGNTCRSPMAEGILREMARQEGLQNMDVTSAGVGTLNGYAASEYAVRTAAEHGIDISNHHSRQLISSLIDEADLILAMALSHYEKVRALYPQAADRVFMLKGFPDGKAERSLSISDPIGMEYEEYHKIFNELSLELKRAWPFIKDRYQKKIGGLE